MNRFRASMLLTALILCLTSASSSLPAQQRAVQFTLTGSVIDSTTQKGVEFATVALADAQGRVVNMVAADGSGKFNVELRQPGEFNLSITALGFTSHTSKVTVTAGSEKTVHIGTFYLRGGVDIGEVTVSGQKPLITMDADKLTYSVETDPESQSSTLVDIMRKVPQLSVDGEDNVLLNGQSNYKVLVNGKTSSLYSNNFKEVIRSMPANSIKDIEVITNPSMRYESEGIGGIINIITQRRTIGYRGNISMGAGSYGQISPSFNGAIQLGKFSLSGYYGYYRTGIAESTSRSEQENFNSTDRRYINSQGSTDDATRMLQHYYNVEASYEIDSLNLLTLSGWGYNGSQKIVGWSETQMMDPNHTLTSAYRNEQRSRFNYGGLSGSLDYQKLFKKPEQSFTVSYKLDRNPQKRRSTNEYLDTFNFDDYLQYSYNKSNGTEHTIQVDYFDPLTKKHQLEVGTKYILRRNVSDTEVNLWDGPNEVWVPDDSRMNDLDYTQHIWGIYGGYGFRGKGITIRAGGRAETNWNNGTAKTKDGNLDFNNTMFNVVPYVNVAFMFKNAQRASISYTQRLQRPSIWYLNPYVDDTNPMNISYGNPDLDAVVSHTFAANYSRNSQKWNMFIGATASFANNAITQVTTVDGNGVSERTYENIGKEKNYRLNASFGYRIGAKFNLNVSANGGYFVTEAPKLDLKNDGFGYSVRGNASVALWKNANFMVNGGYTKPTVTLQGNQSGYSHYGFGLRQQFFNKKVDLTFWAYNLFNKYMSYHNTTEASSFYRYSESRTAQRRFSVYIGYRFGKTQQLQAKKVRRGINNDDRMNGEGSGQAAVQGGGQ